MSQRFQVGHYTGVEGCLKSISMLETACTKYLGENGIPKEQIWFVDSPTSIAPTSGLVDVVFFGSFWRRFLESGNWPNANYRFWCLSSSAKEVLVKVFGLPEKSIQVIPRENLFPLRSFPKIPDLGGTWIYSGRISPSKNIPLLLSVVSELQTKFSKHVQLVLCGNFDNDNPPESRERFHPNFEDEISNLLEELPWLWKPKVLQGLNSQEWLEQDFKNPVLVNFSTFLCEDFGVSLAQAAQAGWPAILSNWGGHRDEFSNYRLLLDSGRLGFLPSSTSLKSMRAKELARDLNQQWDDASAWSTPHAPTKLAFSFPKNLSLNEMDTLRRQWLMNVREDSQILSLEGQDQFLKTKSGQKFLSEYRAIFAGTPDKWRENLVQSFIENSPQP